MQRFRSYAFHLHATNNCDDSIITNHIFMKKLTILSLSLLALLSSGTIQAEGVHLGYCNGSFPQEGIGLSGNNATISGAIYITPEMLAPYADCQATSLYVGIPQNLTTYPEQLTGWLRTDKEGENLTSGTIEAEGGWLTILLDSPLEVNDYVESGIWAGYEFEQAKKINLLAIGGEKEIENACWIARNGAWTDYKQFGVLPLEVIIEGESLPNHDLALVNCYTASAVKFGSKLNIYGTIVNNAIQEASYPIVTITMEGKVWTDTINVTIPYRGKETFCTEIVLDPQDMQERDLQFDVEILWQDGIVDETLDDNRCQLAVSLVDELFVRKMVVEEGTGSECQWCVRGIVGMAEMKEKHPDNFIGIAVHYYTVNDPYYIGPTEGSYSKYLMNYITSFPGCIINRDGDIHDPNTQELEDYLTAMDPTAVVDVALQASYADEQLTFSSATQFLINNPNADYRLAYVVIENQLPITQTNGYSGGNAGPMGGYEYKPKVVDILVDDVARGIWPTSTGAENSLPQEIQKGQVYNHSLTIRMPKYSDVNNLEAIALVLNAKDGSIMNATKCDYIEGLTSGIQQIEATIGRNAIYDPQGKRLTTTSHGIIIQNGTLMFVTE